MIKSKTKKVKKYRYSRKEIWDNLTKFIRINTSTGRYTIDPDDWFKCRKDLLATKQEDNKECKCVNCLSKKVYKSIICDSKKLYKDLTTPSPLEIEEIETLKHRFMSGKNHCWRELSLQDQKINSLIRNQNKLISLTKRNIK